MNVAVIYCHFCQAWSYLPSCSTSPPFCQFQIILFADRGTLMRKSTEKCRQRASTYGSVLYVAVKTFSTTGVLRCHNTFTVIVPQWYVTLTYHSTTNSSPTWKNGHSQKALSEFKPPPSLTMYAVILHQDFTQRFPHWNTHRSDPTTAGFPQYRRSIPLPIRTAPWQHLQKLKNFKIQVTSTV